MTDAGHLPLTLYNANLQLWLRIGQLLEDNRGQWMELLNRGLQDNLAQAGGEAARLQAGDWSALAMLPGSALWHLAERQAGDLQALAQSAGEHQTAFVEGFQQALDEWQATTTAALEEVSGADPSGPLDALRRLLDQISDVMLPTATAPAASAAGRKPARRTAARTTSAADTAPAAKASRKAAKKTGQRAPGGTAAKTAARKSAPAKKAAAKRAPAKKAAAKRAAKKATARKATGKGGNGAAH